MSYNLTILKAANTTLEVMQGVDDGLMKGLFGLFLVICSGAIVIINLSFYKAKEFMLFTGFFIMFIGGFAFLSGLMSVLGLIICLILAMGSMMMFFLSK